MFYRQNPNTFVLQLLTVLQIVTAIVVSSLIHCRANYFASGNAGRSGPVVSSLAPQLHSPKNCKFHASDSSVLFC